MEEDAGMDEGADESEAMKSKARMISIVLTPGLWTNRSAEFTATNTIAGDVVCRYPA